MSQDPSTPVTVTTIENGQVRATSTDVVATEAPLEIRLADVPIAVVMRTPGHDEDLATGFLLTEGIVLSPAEIAAIAPVAEGGERIEVRLAEGIAIDPEQFRRNLYTTSSCGVCGKASIDAVRITAGALGEGPTIPAVRLDEMAASLRAGQSTFDATGGLHGAGLYDADGGLLSLREDVGRHNAVDKVIGSASRDQWRLHGTALMVSGRVSFEIVQKAAVAGVAVVAGISAASSLAVELALEMGMTVVGFVRSGRAIVYTHPGRIT